MAGKRKKKRRAKKRKKDRRLLPLLKLSVIVALVGAIGCLGTLWYFSRDLPSVDSLKSFEPPQITRVYDRNGAVIGEIFKERRTVIPMTEMPRELVLSMLAAEDADFYVHEGLDYIGMARALLRDVLAGRLKQGGSTITQQVVKLMLLSSERTISRKLRELVLARRLEKAFTKDEILHLYLNYINFGHGRYGVQEAAQFYFGKNASELSLAECALLTGIPQSPARLSPRTHWEASKRRQAYVLHQLEDKREIYWPDLSIKDIEAARNETIKLIPRENGGTKAPEIMSIATRALREALGAEAMRQGGYSVHTSIDLDMQEATRKALQKGLRAVDQRQSVLKPTKKRASKNIKTLKMGRTYWAKVERVARDEPIRLRIGRHDVEMPPSALDRYRGKKNVADAIKKGQVIPVSITQLPTDTHLAVARPELGPEGAAVVLDVRTRDVLAIVGGYHREPGFNRAISATRQPGSTFKPFVYGLAIRNRRYTPASLVLDAPAVYDEWKPKNYEKWRFRGAIRFREALAQSVNMVAIRLIEEVTPEAVINFAKDLGIESPLSNTLSLALGASGVNLLELTGAYATFAGGGRWSPSVIVKKITKGHQKASLISSERSSKQVLSNDEAYVITSLLRTVVERGTAAKASALGLPLAGKTGTSNNARDAWFLGYSPTIAAGVWVGYDDDRPLGRRESGARTALPIWMDIMKAANERRAFPEFIRPPGVVVTSIDPASGLLAYGGQEDAIDEVFLPGTEPSETAMPPDVADPSDFLIEQFEEDGPTDELVAP